MASHPETEIAGGHAPVGHQVELLPELLGCHGDMAVEIAQFVGGVEAAEVNVTRAVAEPPAHLQEGVVHPRGAEIVAYG